VIILLALVLIIGCTLGGVALICTFGWFATTKPRLEHQREMIKIGEEQKKNAIVLRAKDMELTARQLELMRGDTDLIRRFHSQQQEGAE